MTTRFYPWHSNLRDRVRKLVRAEKLPHALLLSGPRYLGKLGFARSLAALLHCTDPTGEEACGKCGNCLLIAAGSHPDTRTIEPEDSRQIKIEQVRDLIGWANQTAQRGGYKTVIIHPAEQMNASSANALLKLLEEPAARSLLMLVSDMPGRLLPTIRSRCQHLNFVVPDRQEAIKFLETHSLARDQATLMLDIAGGAPLAVIEEFTEEYLARRKEIVSLLQRLLEGDNPLAVAAPFEKSDGGQDLAVLYGLFADALRLTLSARDKAIKNKDLMGVLDLLCKRVAVRDLFRVLDAIARERRALASSSNPNQRLLFEALFIDVRQYCSL